MRYSGYAIRTSVIVYMNRLTAESIYPEAFCFKLKKNQILDVQFSTVVKPYLGREVILLLYTKQYHFELQKNLS